MSTSTSGATATPPSPSPLAYWILAVVVFVTLLALSILSSALTVLVTESERTAGVLYTLSIQVFLVAAFAPAAVLAWWRTEI